MFLRMGKAKVGDLGGRNAFDFCQTILRNSTELKFWFKTINVQRSIELTKDDVKIMVEEVPLTKNYYINPTRIKLREC